MHYPMHKKAWFVILLVILLATALWLGAGKGALVRLLPFFMMLLCPLIHGAVIIFLGKSFSQGSHGRQEPDSRDRMQVMGEHLNNGLRYDSMRGGQQWVSGNGGWRKWPRPIIKASVTNAWIVATCTKAEA